MKKRFLLAAAAVAVILPVLALANGLNLNGLGTRAQGMGGAFVSVANDFSVVFWNPAGAAGFRQEMFGFHATDLMPRATYSEWPITMEVPRIDVKSKLSHNLGFLGAYYRPIGSKVVVGLGFGTPSVQGIAWNVLRFSAWDEGTAYDWSRKTEVFMFSPLLAVKLTEWLSVGATLNINLCTSDLKQWGGTLPLGEVGEYVDIGQYEEKMTGWGFGATFGVLAKPIKKLGVGLAIRTPSTISYDGTARLSYFSLYGLPDSSALERKITWPLWIAGGVSFRPIERLLLSADVQWTQWSKLDRITTAYSETAWPDVFPVQSFLGDYSLYHKDVTQIRFGMEYLLTATTALRVGYYNDPSPVQTGFGPDVLYPCPSFDSFAIGIGKTIGDLQLDFGLEYLAGENRTNDVGPVGTSYGMSIVVPSVSVQYKF